MTQILDSIDVATDHDLIAASREGNREAFGGIVRRYQGMITGLIYASCGDIHRSEDVAQETFVLAWKKLSELREPHRLAAWLCQIARYRLLDQIRSTTRENARLDVIKTLPQKTPPQPDAEILSEEEASLLWRTLENIPQPYRETLVLYYRQGQSTARVAVAMETSEEAVRQRLTRGRAMMREQVAGMLERNLSRSAPNAAFTFVVVASLPALAVQSVKAATIGAAAKGAASAGLMTTLLMWIGPIVGVGGGILGMRASLRASETPRERRFIMRGGIWLFIFVLVSVAALIWSSSLFHDPTWSKNSALAVQISMWVGYMVLLPTFTVVMNRKHRRLRKAEGLNPVKPSPPLSDGMRALVIIGSTVGAVSWMLALSLQAGDWITAGVVSGVTAILIGVAIYTLRGTPATAMARYGILHFALLGTLTVIVTNLRLHAWLAAIRHLSLAEAQQRLPFWVINLYLAVFCIGIEAFIIISVLIQERKRPAAED